MKRFKQYLYESEVLNYTERAKTHHTLANSHFTQSKRSKDKDESERHHEAGHLHQKLAKHYEKMNKSFWKQAS